MIDAGTRRRAQGAVFDTDRQFDGELGDEMR